MLMTVKTANLSMIIQIVYFYFKYVYFKLFIYLFTLIFWIAYWVVYILLSLFYHMKQSFIPKTLNIICTPYQSLFTTSTKYSLFIYSYAAM